MSKHAGERVVALVDQIGSMLAGKDQELVGAVLVDLMAIWLAGHFDERGPAATARLRKRVLKLTVTTVEELTLINEKLILQHQRDNETMQ